MTQEFAAAIFGVGRATVSRRWDLLRPVLAQVLTPVRAPSRAGHRQRNRPDRRHDLLPWDCKHIPDLYSTKADTRG
jgi:hypothetical protein